jgi:hypothetical protein
VKKTFSCLTALSLLLLLCLPTAGAGDQVTLHSYWELFPSFVGGRVWTTTELRPNLDLTMGYIVEGHQHAPDKLHTGLDPFFFTARTDVGVFTFGKFRPKWGYGPFDSVMLSGYAPGMVGLKWTGAFEKFDYERFFFWLNAERGKFYGHRFSLPVYPGVSLGVKETAIYLRDFDGMWLCYLPFWPFYLNKYIPSVENTSIDSNSIGLDLVVDLADFLIYGDLHVTEFPLGAEKKNLPIYGAKAGLELKRLFREDLSLQVEYVRTMNYLYSKRDPRLAYEYQGRPLGSPLGPDAERLGFLTSYRVNPDLTLYFGYRRERKGEGKVGDYYENVEEGRENLFLSGVVEERHIPVGGFWYRFLPGLELELLVEAQFLKNAEHQPGEPGTRTAGYLTLRWTF